MSFDIASTGDILEISVSGSLNRAEVLAVWDAIEKHPHYERVRGGLVLFASGIAWDINNSEMADLGRKVTRLRPMRWAFVAPDPLSFGMVRMFESQAAGDGSYAPFSNAEKARQWLSA